MRIWRLSKANFGVVMMANRRKSIEAFRRDADDRFVLHDFTGHAMFEFQCIGANIAASAIFENV